MRSETENLLAVGR